MRTKAFPLLLILLSLASCRTVKAPPEPSKTVGLPTAKAERPGPLSPDLIEPASPGPSGQPTSGGRTSPGVSPGSSIAVAKPFVKIAEQSDPSGDTGLAGGGIGYADVILVRIEDNGSRARIIVDMRADIPPTLPADEVVGVGINFYRDSTQTESEYQVFIDGEPEGWFAYLTGPTGFVEYPGTFQLGGRRMAFELPWSALGNLKGSGFDCFADWSKNSLVPQASEDHAPDSGRASFSR